MKTPLISVIMPVYNGAAAVIEAVKSILNQTYGNFELIIINDGSKDDTADVISSIRDHRVRVFHQGNCGLADTLNRGIALAKGEYIARMDHDDLALPTRFEKQIDFLNQQQDYALVGTRAEIWKGTEVTNRVHDHPLDDATLRFELLFNNPFVHSSVMIRKSVLDEIGMYMAGKTGSFPEDYELWSRISRYYKIANLAERLTIYREMPKSISRSQSYTFDKSLVEISAANIAAASEFSSPSSDMMDIAALTHSEYSFLSKRPDMESMIQLITDLGLKIHSKYASSDSNVLKKMDLRIRRLKRDYRIFHYHLGWVRPIARFVRKAYVS